MINVRLVIEYDGVAFHGWQLQDGVPTVQGELAKAITTYLRAPIAPLHSSGRTDAGVHARGQVVTFYFEGAPFALDRFAWGVSSLLRGKLAVLKVDIAPNDFHPREDAISKQYSYHIINRFVPATLDRGRVWEVQQSLSLERMQAAAQALLGEHDFASFQGAGCTAKSTVRKVLESEVSKVGDLVTYRVVGAGFLRYMVRNIVGTLVEIGDGSLTKYTMHQILAARDRNLAGITAPPHGLCLDEVFY